MESDWKRSEGKAGRLKHTAGTYSGDSDAKDLFFIPRTFCVSIDYVCRSFDHKT